ncbi:MAG: bifunctional folylpolyglutamate synthase/dihydrofolate synthase [Firmicutes bacterium]|nr:bifunctional folylpolyglutamate synthase/dihydrofolate synthase [Bacillota bacterium]
MMAVGFLESLKRFGEKPGLSRIRFLLARMGDPQDAYPAVHVAGTNGKGSTAAMIAAALKAAGLRVGLFTSPHLVRYNERIAVDGEPIGDDELGPLLEELKGHAEAAAARPEVGQPTEFEVGTAAALAHFARRRVDLAVVEVGLGGRLDATNVVRPAVTVITPVGRDHTEVLGEDLASIAEEKAGIIKPQVPVVCGRQRPEAMPVIQARCASVGAPLYRFGIDFEARLVSADRRGTSFDARWRDRWLLGLSVPLLGSHQAENGAVAVAALCRLAEDGWPVTEEAVRAGLAAVRWLGRLEVVERRPWVILDGAHNPDGCRALRQGLEEVFPGVRPVFVIGMLRNKPIDDMLGELLPMATAAVFTAPASSRTPAADPHELARRASGLVPLSAVEPQPSAALAKARDLAGPEGLVCVCGSLYLVGELRGCMERDLRRLTE